MKRIAVILMLLGLFALLATPALAKNQNAAQSNPSQACATNTILVEFAPGQTFPLEIPSHGGCVSTVATRGSTVAMGDYSNAAYVAQCKLLRSELPADLWNAPVEIVQTEDGPINIGGFGGKIVTCVDLLQGYHSGTLGHLE